VNRPGFDGDIETRKDPVHGCPRKYPDELRERATRLAVEARRDPAARAGAIRRIADQLDVHPEALRTWVKRAETDEGLSEGTTSQDAARIAELKREVKELRRANAILKSASAFFAAELDRPLR
jgi:transposase